MDAALVVLGQEPAIEELLRKFVFVGAKANPAETAGSRCQVDWTERCLDAPIKDMSLAELLLQLSLSGGEAPIGLLPMSSKHLIEPLVALSI
jgi:hypothetical protein